MLTEGVDEAGLLLADDLGLGKTVTAICPMAAPGNLPAVVVYPAGLPNHAARLSGVVVVAKVLPSGAVRDRRVGRGRGTLGSGV